MSDKKEKLASADRNLWYKFMLKSIELDRGNTTDERKPLGWHWFWGIYLSQDESREFPVFTLTEIQKKLPDEHWLNKIDDAPLKYDISHGALDNILKESAASALQSLLKEHRYKKMPDEINFSDLLFNNPVDFSDFIFPLHVNFLNSEFSYDVRFIRTLFYRGASFTATKFSNSLYFNDAKFFSNVDFMDVTFSKGASFGNVVFSDDAVFYKANFSNDAFFTGAKFSRIAAFDKTKFARLSFFSNATFSIGVTFSNAIFSHRVAFDQVKITGPTRFKNAEFKTYPPRFDKANIYSDIIWNKSKWPKLNKKSDPDTVEQNKDAYENLASLMRDLDKYHDEHFFYRHEMRCRRWLTNNPFTRFAYWLYEILADYGYGFEYALAWWGLHILSGAILIGAATKSIYSKACDLAGNFYLDLIASLANAHGFLFFNNGPLEKCYDTFTEIPMFKIIWGAQTIIGIVLLFLLLLTIRVRFRLR